jgi:hypothetical protein
MYLLRLVVKGVDRAGIHNTRDGHLEWKQLGRRGIERRPGGRKGDADAWPRLAGLLRHRSKVLEPDRGVRDTAAEAILRPPVCGHDQVAEPNLARLAADSAHDDQGVALGPARAGRQLGELAPGELGRLAVGLQLNAKLGLVFRLCAAAHHDESAEREDGLAVETTLLGQACERRARETPESLDVAEILLIDLDLFLKSLGVNREFLDQLQRIYS